MHIKKILMPVAGGELREPVMRVAIVTARRFQAHLEVLCIRPDPREMMPYATLGMSERMRKQVIDAGQRNADEQVSKARAVFEDTCARWNIPVADDLQTGQVPSAAWREEAGRGSYIVSRDGRLCDLIILPGPFDVSPPPRILEAALRETGRPVFVVPETPPKSVATHIAIGWNGTVEAARAVGSALPLPLQSAQKVSVYTTEKSMQVRPNADEVLEYLGWHGIDASIHMLDVRDRSVEEAIVEDARKQGVDLLLIGAYSHRRVHEMIFGGVTRHVLASGEIPAVLVH